MKARHLVAVAALSMCACETEAPWSPSYRPYVPPAALPDEGPPSPFGPTVRAQTAPPPISGGTLLVANGGHTAIAADPDRDQIYVVNLDTFAARAIPVFAGDEPGRVTIDGTGRAHVVLRRGGAIASIDVATAKLVARREVCPAPRGIAFDPQRNALYVACAGGEIVYLDVADGAATVLSRLDRDLRDVILDQGELLVSRFRAPELLHIARDGTLLERDAPVHGWRERTPSIAWRTIAMPGGGAAMVHELARVAIPPAPSPAYYGPPPPQQDGLGSATDDPCGGSVVENTVSFFGKAQETMPTRRLLPQAVLPVDLAVSPDGTTFAVVAAGNAYQPSRETVYAMPVADPGDCAVLVPQSVPEGEVTSVAFAKDEIVVQLREPAALHLVKSGVTVMLSDASRKDTGHAMFHATSGQAIACASCHAEGGDDGLVWFLPGQGQRRTPSLRGTLAGTAPYHWEGDLQDLPSLFQAVLVGKMGAPPPKATEADALRGWLEHIPPPIPLGTASLSSRAHGEALFTSATVGCSGCHAGPMRTNNATVDVGTGGAFQVPSLVGIGWRAPYLHHGRASTLEERFSASTAGHGNVADLSDDDVHDLINFLDGL